MTKGVATVIPAKAGIHLEFLNLDYFNRNESKMNEMIHIKSLKVIRIILYLFFSFSAVIGLCECGENHALKDSTSDSIFEGDIPVIDSIADSGCPERLEPLEPSSQIIIIGNGTPESCNSDALVQGVVSLNSQGGGTLLFDCGGEVTITVTSPLEIRTPMIIDGGNKVTLSGGGKTQIIKVDHYVDLVIQRITISDGLTEESGAGIEHPWYGTLKAIDVRFINNHCISKEHDVGGGGVFAGGLSEAIFSGCVFARNSASNGGGLLNRGSNLTIIDCVFVENEATSFGESGQYGNGGGLYIDGMNYDSPRDFRMCGTVFENNNAKQHGSAVFSYFYSGSNSYVDKCIFKGNNFDGSPSGGAGGFYHEVNQLLLTDSTFSENRSGGHAASIFIGSGSTAQIINCTFWGNRTAGNGAGIFDGSSPLKIKNVTFSSNDADYGPAIFKGQDASIEVANTIFAYNTTSNRYSALSCHEPLIDGGGNIQWPAKKPNGSDDVPCAENILFADPLLLLLSDNGGPTPTMALSPGSPAIGIGNDCPATDQRGVARPEKCDAGAYEYQD